MVHAQHKKKKHSRRMKQGEGGRDDSTSPTSCITMHLTSAGHASKCINNRNTNINQRKHFGGKIDTETNSSASTLTAPRGSNNKIAALKQQLFPQHEDCNSGRRQCEDRVSPSSPSISGNSCSDCDSNSSGDKENSITSPSSVDLFAAGWAKAFCKERKKHYYYTLDRSRVVWDNPLQGPKAGRNIL